SFLSMLPPPLNSTLFPYTTLFRSTIPSVPVQANTGNVYSFRLPNQTLHTAALSTVCCDTWSAGSRGCTGILPGTPIFLHIPHLSQNDTTDQPLYQMRS